MEDDGNCQFRALSSECYGTQRFHRAIRLKVVQHIEEQVRRSRARVTRFVAERGGRDYQVRLSKVPRCGLGASLSAKHQTQYGTNYFLMRAVSSVALSDLIPLYFFLKM
jgi:hypothetical protein